MMFSTFLHAWVGLRVRNDPGSIRAHPTYLCPPRVSLNSSDSRPLGVPVMSGTSL